MTEEEVFNERFQMTLPERLRYLGSLPKCCHEEQIFLNAAADQLEEAWGLIARANLRENTELRDRAPNR